MSQVQNIPYAELEVGQKAEYTSSIAERDLQLFAAVSGDRNPVHLDAPSISARPCASPVRSSSATT